VRIVRVTPREPLPEPLEALVGAVLARDLAVAGERWPKGRRLSAGDLALLAGGAVRGRGPWTDARPDAPAFPVTLLVPGADDVHEDDAAVRLAAAVAGPGLAVRGPAESRVDLVAAQPGVVRVRAALLERLDAIDGLAVFSVLDGQPVVEGALVASVKTGPHLVPEASVARAEALAVRQGPVVEVRPYIRRRVAAVVKETLGPAARERFEAALGAKVESLASEIVDIVYVADDANTVTAVLRSLTRGRNRVDLVLTAGAASTDPADAIFAGLTAIGGRITSHGVPAHPGSMLWLGRAGRTAFLGLPTCGAYSKATAADLLLPWLLAGEPPSRRTVARLGHGGILTRDMRFRFPPYARDLDAPGG
jgi:hypothetical protein